MTHCTQGPAAGRGARGSAQLCVGAGKSEEGIVLVNLVFVSLSMGRDFPGAALGHREPGEAARGFGVEEGVEQKRLGDSLLQQQ